MGNDVIQPPSEFDQPEEQTNVMESGLLRVLTKKSTAATGEVRALVDDEGLAPRASPPPIPAPPAATASSVTSELPTEISVTSELPMEISVAEELPPPPKISATDPIAAGDAARMEVTAETALPRGNLATAYLTPPAARRRSPVITVALVVGALVLAADFYIFVLHRRPPRPTPAGPPAMPTYVVLPAAAAEVHPVVPETTLDTTADTKSASPGNKPAAAPPATADADSAAAGVAAKSRRHHHHHSRSSH
jgi:hypothetical protein